MPWGWECRAKLVKQNPAKPTVPRETKKTLWPAPNHYDTPQIIGGNGYDKIKRAPAYTFGYRTPFITKPSALPYAPQLDIHGMSKKGIYKITHGVVSPVIEVGGFVKKPGPGAHTPNFKVQIKRPPAYTCRPAVRPAFKSRDMWTPPPNMYWPPIPSKKPPAYSLGAAPVVPAPPNYPGPSEHDPNFKYVEKSKPAFSFGYPFRPLRLSSNDSPAPNTYCEKKYMYPKRNIPAPTFGIRHSPYLGKPPIYEKPSNLAITLKTE